MISSFVFSMLLLVLRKFGVFMPTHYALILTVAVTTISWMLTAFLGPQTDRAKLISFYRKVRPFGPGWQGHPQGGGHFGGRRKGHRRQLPRGPYRLGLRLSDHLVGPVHGRQRPLRPLGLRRRALRRVRRKRPRPHQGRQPAVEQGAGRGVEVKSPN